MNIGILKSLFSGAAEKDMNESNVPGSAPHDPSIYGNHHISEPHSFAKVNPLHFTPKPGMTDGEVWDMAMTMSNRRKMSGTDVYGAGMWMDGILTGAMKMRDMYEKELADLRLKLITQQHTS